MIVVADSGPLRYLLVIGHIDILPPLFDRVLIPAAVRQELTHPRAPALVRNWLENAPAWLEVHPALESGDPSIDALDVGEQQAISLALQVAAQYILMDDEQGRLAAMRKHFTVVGTVGILQRAANRGLLDFASALSRLTATNFRMSPAFRRAILDQIKDQ
jgi:predicted nucleic acid-binding protein